MPRLECPVDRIALADGETHCPRCGLRIAALPRRQGSGDGTGGTTARRLLRLGDGSVAAVLDGLIYGGLLLFAAGLYAGFDSARGGRFLLTFDNVAAIVGALVLASSFAMGGIRLGILRRDQQIADRLGSRAPRVSRAIRVTVGVAGALPLVVALLLSFVVTW